MHWGCLQATLQKFGIKGFVLSAIIFLYCKLLAGIYTSNVMLDNFFITNGTNLGCPFSPFFSMLMEPLAAAIRPNYLISGIEMGNYSHKIELFANMILTLSNPAPSLCTVQQIFDRFHKISYYRERAMKSSILPIGINCCSLRSLSHGRLHGMDSA